ncbi:hypothetical protein X777_09832 [Ooceraea biroi]|uniref:Uncharacterized protein n=1 Tax=Ooceraea biroi TaxID=2015173 RepID=A0A026W654_OOCBI|nr:hypothetical protein X777_09832 [Ooceraea biroi]
MKFSRDPTLLVLVCIRRCRAICRRKGAYFFAANSRTWWRSKKEGVERNEGNDDVDDEAEEEEEEEEKQEETLTVGLREAFLRGPGVYATR